MKTILYLLIVVFAAILALNLFKISQGQTPQISYDDQLPIGVTQDSIRRDREMPRPAEAMDPKWTLHPDWRDSPMFQQGGPYEIQRMRDGSLRKTGPLWHRENYSQKTPIFSVREGQE